MARLPVLQALLKDDGVELPAAGGAEKSIHCFFPEHDDRTASMSVNVVKGVYNCHGCGRGGNAWQYLADVRGLAPREAMQALEAVGATETYAKASRRSAEDTERRHAREPGSVSDIPETAKVGKGRASLKVVYDYRTAAGEPVFRVGRYEIARDDKDKPDKTFRSYTPKPGGGYWCVGPTSDQLPKAERLARYPVYRAPEIAEAVKRWRGKPDGAREQIWLVEGEKCADILARVKSPGGFSPHVASLYGGAKHPLDNHDLTILYGQRIVVFGDADKAGRAHAKALGKHLAAHNCEVKYVLPPGDDHYDAGDAAAEGWDALMAFIQRAGGVQMHTDVFRPAADAEEVETLEPSAMAKNSEFQVWGMEGDKIVIQRSTTHKVFTVGMGAISSEGNLLKIAPLGWWRSLAGGKHPTAKHRAVWADGILRAAEMRGEISTQGTGMWGRGAYRSADGDVAFHLGTHLLRPDSAGMLTVEHSLTQEVGSHEIFLAGPKIEMHDDAQAALYASDLFDAVLRYRWESEAHGHAFAGWLVTSLVGGALPFRPMLWLTALARSGKTFLLSEVVRRLFTDLVTGWSSVTEAGMAFSTRGTSLPAYIDEFEPEVSNQRRIEAILSLMRSATSGDAARTRGTVDGEVNETRVRFSLLFASVARPKLNDANASRITPVRLAVAGVPDWPSVRDAILSSLTRERALAIRTHIIRNTAKIVEHAKEIEDEFLAQPDSDTRDAQIRGALSAGVAFLSADDGFRLGRRVQSLADEHALFMALMASVVHQRFDDPLTVGTMLRMAHFDIQGVYQPPALRDEPAKKMTGQVNRLGFAMDDGENLLCAVDWRPMSELLAGTAHMHTAVDEALLEMPGARQGKRRRFGGVQKRTVVLPLAELRKLGLFTFDRT